MSSAWSRAPAGPRTRAVVPADTATCRTCLRELFEPAKNRRWRYPFINCTDCGPRFTIVRSVPYDRRRTTMAAFTMCDACRAEYDRPGRPQLPRRAQRLRCVRATGGRSVERGERIAAGDAALGAAAARLADGSIVAMKGLGGYQLAVDASDDEAVERLRARKGRPHKPFAVMVRDVATAGRVVQLDAASRDALVSPAHPIVLAPRARRRLSQRPWPRVWASSALMLPVTPAAPPARSATVRRSSS